MFEVQIVFTSLFVIRMFVCSIFSKNLVPLCLCVSVPILQSRGLWPPNLTYRNFKVASSLRSPSAKANLFLAFGERKLLSRGHWPLKFTYRKFKVASSLRSPSAKANLFLAFGERKLLSRGHWPPNLTYRNFKVASSLRSPSAKANLFLAFGERKLPRVAAIGRLIQW
jgi:hypothetical protein